MNTLVSAAALALLATSTQPAAAPAGHTMVAGNELRWGPAPAALPAGAQAAVLSGDPAKAGPFVMRLKLPKDYVVPPHTHPRTETVTVLSGTIHVGMGAKVEQANIKELGAGGLFSVEPGSPHYVHVASEAVLQLNATGPWAVNYVNPADDPRRPK